MHDSLASDCEQQLLVRDRDSQATAIVVVHDTRLGPAHGGIRRWPYENLGDAMRDVVALAQAMTFKCALAEVPAGGGKAVIVDHPGLDREGAYRLVGRTVEQLQGKFFTGPDVNTSAADLRVVAEQTRFVAAPAAGGGDESDDGPGDDGPGDLAAATAIGVMAALEALVERLQLPLAGLRVAVQGLGAVGSGVCARLAAAGAKLFVSDVMADRVAAAVQDHGAVAVDTTAITETPCDVFAPCALGSVLTEQIAASLPARGVCGAANNILTGEVAASILHRRSVLVVPDIVANAGALIQGATWHLTGERVPPERLQRITRTAREVLARAAAEDLPPSVLAHQLARERVERGPGAA